MASTADRLRLVARNTNWGDVGSVKYGLMEGYPKIRAERLGTVGTEQYCMRAVDLEKFIALSFPPFIEEENADPEEARTIFTRRRSMPGLPGLHTNSIDAVPFSGKLPGDPFLADPNAPADTYDDFVLVTIDYATFLSEQQDDDLFFEHLVNVGGQYLSITPAKTKLGMTDVDGERFISPGEEVEQDNKDSDMAIMRTVPLIEHSLRYPVYPKPPWPTILEQLGTVNQEAMPVFFDAKKETVLFMGLSGSQRIINDGGKITLPWAIDLRFSQRHIAENVSTSPSGKKHVFGWNHVFSGNKGTWVRAIRSDGSPLYESADHKLLFRADD